MIHRLVFGELSMNAHRRILEIRNKLIIHKELISSLIKASNRARKNILLETTTKQRRLLTLIIFLVIDGTITLTGDDYKSLIKSKLMPFIEHNFSWKNRRSADNVLKLLKISKVLPIILSRIIKK